MLYIDTKTWLPDDLLIKADKMTMANSVELRVPLLDHRSSGICRVVAAELQVERVYDKIHSQEGYCLRKFRKRFEIGRRPGSRCLMSRGFGTISRMSSGVC